MKTLLLVLAMIVPATSALAVGPPIPVRTATPDEANARIGMLRYAENVKLENALFGSGKLPKGCTFELRDPSGEWRNPNIVISCDKSEFSYCDAVGVECVR